MKPVATSLLAALLAALTLAACSTTGGSNTEVYGEIKGGYEVSKTR
ncbi:outer membrane protein assembly factor BamE (lipoprotein component of BamABCDE complex) [Neisseria sp. HSC-16F19]|nr:hypothetical protein [Neisseria sp. HSC-16F19]MCP2041819.1 outer membrane protein assembly factor BamE (lipoprotein component of BamABCDE complex) [Neisseria sp. HSC-16F19]